MAGLKCAAVAPDVSLSAATTKTVLQITAPTNQRLMVTQAKIWFHGVAPTDTPVQVRILRQTTAGTGTSTTPVKNDVGSETIQSTAARNFTVEPTAGDVLEHMRIHPQSGIPIIYPITEEIPVPGGGRLGIECTAPQAVTVSAQFNYRE